jgi:hypothetical protein
VPSRHPSDVTIGQSHRGSGAGVSVMSNWHAESRPDRRVDRIRRIADWFGRYL